MLDARSTAEDTRELLERAEQREESRTGAVAQILRRIDRQVDYIERLLFASPDERDDDVRKECACEAGRDPRDVDGPDASGEPTRRPPPRRASS